MIQVKRVYETPEIRDGSRFLVERLWPRGLPKTEVPMEAWQKDAGPSTELRKWFSHDPQKWDQFQRRYFAELAGRPEAWKPILTAARRGTVTLLYSSRDEEHNNAVALKRFLGATPEARRNTNHVAHRRQAHSKTLKVSGLKDRGEERKRG
jgi:uncharacterized protein YeaO (DUF488 family)